MKALNTKVYQNPLRGFQDSMCRRTNDLTIMHSLRALLTVTSASVLSKLTIWSEFHVKGERRLNVNGDVSRFTI